MDFMQAVKSVLSNYANFNGRARRSEFWWFYLAMILAFIVAGFIDGLIFGTIGLFYIVVALGVIIPSLALTFRRLHDTGKSAWWLLISLIPLIGGLALLYFYIQDSQEGENQFGPDPKGRTAASE